MKIKLLFLILIIIFINNNNNFIYGLEKKIEVLLWSGFSWAGYGTKDYKLPNYLGQHVVKKDCSVECIYRNDRNYQSEVNAILFEGQPFASWSYTFLKDPPFFPQKEVGQLFINFGYEHEKYFPLVGHNGYLRHMDINNTYRHSDQVQSTFACSWGSGENGDIENFRKPPVPFKQKKYTVGFMSTNCNAGGAIYRTCYIIDMMKHMQVDALGSCLHNKDLDKKDFPHEVFSDLGDSLRIKEKVLSKYKFSLAFENNNITDYVTEKVFTSLLSGSIPVYMGSPNIDEWVPEKSIIKTDDFKSPKDLVNYLNYLSNNETAYNEYFEWKKKPFAKGFVEKYQRCMFYNSDCRVCEEVYRQLESQKLDQSYSDGFRDTFGEPPSVFRSRKVLQLDINSCLRITHDSQKVEFNGLDMVPNINGRFTIMFWIQINSDINEEKKLISLGSSDNQIEILLTPIWKRNYLKVCIQFKCFLSESPIFTGDWRHIGITVGKSNNNNNNNNNDFISTTTTTTTSGNTNNINQFTSKNNTGNGNSHTSNLRIYFDGELDTSMITVVDADNLDVSPILIGCGSKVSNWLMDDFTIFHTDLDQKEVASAQFKKYKGNEPNILKYFTFNSEHIKDYSIYRQNTFIDFNSTKTLDYFDKKLVLKVNK